MTETEASIDFANVLLKHTIATAILTVTRRVQSTQSSYTRHECDMIEALFADILFSPGDISLRNRYLCIGLHPLILGYGKLAETQIYKFDGTDSSILFPRSLNGTSILPLSRGSVLLDTGLQHLFLLLNIPESGFFRHLCFEREII